MYLTAQRVLSGSRRRGVNVYEYHHGPITWSLPLPDNLRPEHNPGELVDRWEQVPPPGNSVLSFLDVVVPDKLPRPQVINWVAMLKDLVPARPLTEEHYVGPLWVRFGMSPRIGIPPRTELAALAAFLVLALQGLPLPPAP
jgi:hypothetical protein